LEGLPADVEPYDASRTSCRIIELVDAGAMLVVYVAGQSQNRFVVDDSERYRL
jgi:hypothetical protein